MFSCRYNRASAQSDPGDARGAVRSRHAHKGGGGCRGWPRRRSRGRLGRYDHGGHFGLGHPEALGPLRHRSAGGIPQGLQRGAQQHQQDVNPLMRLALAHPKQPPVHEMRRADTVLGIIRERGKQGLPLGDLYRQLYNPDLYLRAYARL
jgi:hypothetical protein